MRRREIYWSLYRISDKKQINDLRTDHCEAILEVLTEEQQKDWLIWRDGYKSWKPLSDFPNLLLALRQQESPQPPPPREQTSTSATVSVQVPATSASKLTKTVVSQAAETPDAPSSEQTKSSSSSAIVGGRSMPLESDGVEEVSLSLEDSGSAEDRDNARFERRFEVRIMTGDRQIQNSTVNVSMKGMMLKEPLPKGLPRMFNVGISVGEQVLTLVCSEVRSLDGSPSMRLKIEVNDNPDLLRAALLAE